MEVHQSRCEIAMRTLPVALMLLLAAAYAPCQVPVNEGSDLAGGETVPDSKLRYFGEVDDGVYKGSKPRSDAD